MDISQLAVDTAHALAPLAPVLVGGAEAAAKGVGEEGTREASAAAKRLWSRIRHRSGGEQDRLDHAMHKIASGQPTAVDDLAAVIAPILEQDEEVARIASVTISEMWNPAVNSRQVN